MGRQSRADREPSSANVARKRVGNGAVQGATLLSQIGLVLFIITFSVLGLARLLLRRQEGHA